MSDNLRVMRSGKIGLTVIVLAVINLTTGGLYAQSSVEATAIAEVVDVLKASEVHSLNFGKFTPEEQGGEIIITPDGVRRSNGTVSLSGGIFNPASFQLFGQPDAPVSILLPQSTVVLTNSITGKQMEVYDWTIGGGISLMGTVVLTKGSAIMNIGATLKVGTISDNPVGQYSGSYIIIFSYN